MSACPLRTAENAPVEIGRTYCIVHAHRGRFNAKILDLYRYSDGWYAQARITRGRAIGGLTPERGPGDPVTIRLASCQLLNPEHWPKDKASDYPDTGGDDGTLPTPPDDGETREGTHGRPGSQHGQGGPILQRSATGSASAS